MNKILIVDDDKHLLLGLTARLKAHGYQVIAAVDAGGAIARALTDEPDLVILDLGLPAGDGFVVLDRMKNHPDLAGVPVIVLSARDPVENEKRALGAGAVAFIQKPPDNQQFLSAIRRVLSPVAAGAIKV